MRLTPSDALVFVLRQSPDWAALADDFEAGRPVPAARYLPEGVRFFTPDIPARIATWNREFPVNFFRCRQRLKEIAARQMGRVARGELHTQDDLPALQPRLAGRNFLLFYLDDDDWFAPDAFDRLAGIDFDPAAVAVFPLIRFGVDSFTFVRPEQPARCVVGRPFPCQWRFQTNNYALPPELTASPHLFPLNPHVDASHHADACGIPDAYHDLLVSATMKSPASAISIKQLDDPVAFRTSIRQFVTRLGGLAIPDAAGWTRAPVREVVELFTALLG